MRLLILMLLMLPACKPDANAEPSTTSRPPDQYDPEKAFRVGPFTKPIRTPKPGDWLHEHEEPGQSFEQWKRDKPNIPDAQRPTIYLQPIGSFSGPRTVDLDELETFTTTFFQMPVVVRPPIALRQFPTRRHPDFGWQILAGDVLDALEERLPADAYFILGVTMSDLYPRPSWNFVFGMASLKRRVGVFSFARYSPQADELTPSQQRKMTERAFKVLSHESGHMFGINHCKAYHCGMNGANHLAETDGAPLSFCPVCLKKLHAAVGFDVAARDAQLAEVLDDVGLSRHAQWYRDRREWLLKP